MESYKIHSKDLIQRFESGLLSYQVSERTLKDQVARIRHLLDFMFQKKLEVYDESVGEQFLHFEHNKCQVPPHTLARDARAILLLNSIARGTAYPASKRKLSYRFPGELGTFAQKFVTEEITSHGFSQGTIDCYKSSLSRFSVSMHINGITSKNIGREDMVKFLSTMPNSRSYVITPVRRFLKYLYQEQYIKEDLSIVFEGIRTKKPIKLPSYYSKEEVQRIENSVDRSGRVGKRNYAVILLASRLGIRASDIANLRLSDIDWDNNQLHFVQIKTGQPILLPLLADVGNAIIDYILHGRPESDIKHLFLTFRRPYKILTHSAITSIVDKYMRESNVNMENRHHGAHSLRHSIATVLMDNNVSLPVISDILGHRTSLSTMRYLEINTKSLMDCSLDVPLVDNKFYNQHDGFFYE